MDDTKMCVIEPEKVCDDCGDCMRCDLDPTKICDNCCRCIAMEDEGSEFRTRTVTRGGLEKGREYSTDPSPAPVYRKAQPKPKKSEPWVAGDEPSELTPELVEYWERILIEHGEAPADDGFGEIEVSHRDPISGRRPRRQRRE
ncbi:MAG: hypothetical protein II124_00045 [Clostridia bacterium]|nr:hypothetical protein [Clostridia bacterium]MBQ2518168.1 hypothetical protein [Clostridia bacterium]